MCENLFIKNLFRLADFRARFCLAMRKPIALTITSASPNPTGSMSCREVEEIEGSSHLRHPPSSSSIDRVHSSDVGRQRRISALSECFIAAPKPLGAVRTPRFYPSEHGLSDDTQNASVRFGRTPTERGSRAHQHRCSVLRRTILAC